MDNGHHRCCCCLLLVSVKYTFCTSSSLFWVPFPCRVVVPLSHRRVQARSLLLYPTCNSLHPFTFPTFLHHCDAYSVFLRNLLRLFQYTRICNTYFPTRCHRSKLAGHVAIPLYNRTRPLPLRTSARSHILVVLEIALLMDLDYTHLFGIRLCSQATIYK